MNFLETLTLNVGCNSTIRKPLIPQESEIKRDANIIVGNINFSEFFINSVDRQIIFLSKIIYHWILSETQRLKITNLKTEISKYANITVGNIHYLDLIVNPVNR